MKCRAQAQVLKACSLDGGAIWGVDLNSWRQSQEGSVIQDEHSVSHQSHLTLGFLFAMRCVLASFVSV